MLDCAVPRNHFGIRSTDREAEKRKRNKNARRAAGIAHIEVGDGWFGIIDVVLGDCVVTVLRRR